MTHTMKAWTGLMAMALVAGWTVAVAARATTVKGTVEAVDKAKVEVAVHDEHGKAGAPVWFAVTPQTKVTRGEKAVAWADAALKAGETVTIVVNAGDEAGVDWTCPMHPEVIEAKAGKCPKCGMALREKARLAKAAELHIAR